MQIIKETAFHILSSGILVNFYELPIEIGKPGVFKNRRFAPNFSENFVSPYNYIERV